MNEKYIVRDFGELTDIVFKDKDSNPTVKGVGKIELISHGSDGEIVEKEVISDNLVKGNNVIKDPIIFNAMIRHQITGRNYGLYNKNNSWGASTPSYLYLLDARNVPDVEVDKLDCRLNPTDTPTIAYARIGTVETTNDKRGTWISTDTTYPSPDVKRIEMICDFPLITGNGADGLGGTFDTIALIDGTWEDWDLDARKMLAMPMGYGGTGWKSGYHVQSSTYKHTYLHAHYDGRLYGVEVTVDEVTSNQIINLYYFDRFGQKRDMCSYDTGQTGALHYISIDILEDGDLGVFHMLPSENSVWKAKLLKIDRSGTLADSVVSDTAVPDTYKPAMVDWNLSTGVVSLAFMDSADSNTVHLLQVNSDGTDYKALTNTNTTSTYRTKHPGWGEFVKVAGKTYSFISPGFGVHEEGYYYSGFQMRGLNLLFDFEDDKFAFINWNAVSQYKRVLVNYNKDDVLTAAPTSTSGTDSEVDTPAPIKRCSKTGLNAILGRVTYDDLTSDTSRLVYAPDTVYFGSNKLIAVNKFAPITKTEQRTVRVTYALEFDYSNLDLADKRLDPSSNPIKY